jgi:serine/threonine protein kinase
MTLLLPLSKKFPANNTHMLCHCFHITSFRFGEAFSYLGTGPDAEQRYNAAELDNPCCPYIAQGDDLYQGGALTALEKSFVQACIAEDPAQRWSAQQLLQHPYLTQQE